MPEKISILKESGETLSSNVVSVFMIPDTEKKYIITTENAVDPHGLTVLHVSEIVDGGLQKIATDEEWSSIKTIMRAIISGNVGSYQYLPTVESIKASGQYSRDISVSASASKQMIDNYAAGEKSNVAVQPVQQVAPVAPSPDPVPPTPAPANPAASIFPSGGTVDNTDDELVPGIAEIAVQPPVTPVVPVSSAIPVTPAPTTPVASVSVPDSGMVQQPAPVQQVPVVESVQPVQVPVAPVEQPVPAIQPVIVTADVPAPTPVVAATEAVPTVMNNDVQVPNIPIDTGEVAPISASNIQINSDVVNPVPVVVTGEPVPTPIAIQPEVQVVQPSVTVPTSQIAQEAQAAVPMPEVKIDTSAAPSFAPDATLDQVIVAAQEMFMEGVKNLVQTIQEKVYRDLYLREEEVKKKEALLEQREKMINEQMMTMMTNFMQGTAMNATPVTAPIAVAGAADEQK